MSTVSNATHCSRTIGFSAFSFFISLGSVVSATDPIPSWTSTDGKSVTAEFSSLQSEILEVRRAGKVYKVPLSRLTPQSRIQAKQLAMRQAMERRSEFELTGNESLGTLWNLLQDQNQQVVSVLDFARRSSEVTDFFSDKLQPIQLTQDELMAMLNDLCSEDAETWRGAYKRLCLLDPRMVMDAEALLNLEAFQKFPNRNRLVDVLAGAELDSPYSACGLEFKKIEWTTSSSGAISFSASEPADPKYANYGYSAENLRDAFKQEYPAITHALAVLEYVDTREATELIKKVASGDSRISVTRIAQMILSQKATSKPTTPEEAWKNLTSGSGEFTSGHSFNEALLSDDRCLLALAQDPAVTTRFLNTKLKPQNFSRDDFEKMLSDFSSDDESVWMSAYEKLQVLSPLLEYSITELLELEAYQEYPARHRLVDLLTNTPIDSPRSATNAKFEFVTLKEQLVFGEPGICMDYRNPDVSSNAGFGSNGAQCYPLSQGTGDIEFAIGLALLEMFETPEAEALIKSIATGHPKLGSTIQAQAILEEWTKN